MPHHTQSLLSQAAAQFSAHAAGNPASRSDPVPARVIRDAHTVLAAGVLRAAAAADTLVITLLADVGEACAGSTTGRRGGGRCGRRGGCGGDTHIVLACRE
jgi:hypothetical protein